MACQLYPTSPILLIGFSVHLLNSMLLLIHL
ncbi:hypothetical protein F383_26232 [Gossypium arboreum]|uniref:Uncharacterized protein n=1 Tax=Gossypium arboreum TaxID=29729 RepID=A0A0B0P2C0_GOSAR|nr:hypothetical protein F383_26232 [Gossypium arboreum]